MENLDEEVMIEIEKDKDEKVMVRRRIYQGDEYFDFRLWYKPKGEKEFRPTKKGFILSADKAMAFAESMSLLVQK